MSAAANCRLLGRWRIVEADLWDRTYLDLCGPATLTITVQGGEIAFGAMEATLYVAHARDSIDFRWYGADEGDQVEGEGTAELLDDGTLEIEFSYENGDEAVLKARCVISSTSLIEEVDYAGVWSQITHLRRVGQPADVAGAVRFLASAQADFITGQTLYVDGGAFTFPNWPKSRVNG